MSTDPSGAYQPPGTDGGGIEMTTSDACPACARPLPEHGLTFTSPCGPTTLAPCGLDVSGVPLQELLDAIEARTIATDTNL